MTFYVLAGIILVSAVLVVTLRNIFHCALFLTSALLSLAMLFFELNAPFVGILQVLIYVGAIMVLIIFAIMLTQRISDQMQRGSNQQLLPSLFFIILFMIFSAGAVKQQSFMQNPARVLDPIMDIGQELMTTYIVPFEVISLILLAVLVGVIVMARRD
jgi:NADH:ubiquinone oxidoreductase subunit 6 (subunit J)